jgi:hypothetical protein
MPHTGSPDPTLRELVELRILSLERATEARFTASESARALQAREYERRLTELNNSHKLAVDERNRVVSREAFDSSLQEYAHWKEEVNAQLIILGTLRAEIAELRGSVQLMTALGNRIQGAMLFVGSMGVAGVLALLLGLARIAGVLQ